MVSKKEALMRRFDRLDPLDHVMLGSYAGMIAWGGVAQFEQPATLTGGAGELLARGVTIAILLFGVLATAGLIVDQTDRRGHQQTELELPMLVGLIGAWMTYVIVVWCLVAGASGPNTPSTLKVFGVLTTVMLVPFVVRLVVLIHDALRTIRAARRAVELGIVDVNGNTIA